MKIPLEGMEQRHTIVGKRGVWAIMSATAYVVS